MVWVKRNPGNSTFQVVDWVRTAAIIPVLASHASGTVFFGSDAASFIWKEIGRNNLYGVTLFFVVSGFLITRVLARGPGGLFQPDLRHFYAHRMGRILPLLFLFVLIGIAILLYGQAHVPGAHLNPRYHGFWFWFCISTFSFNWYEVAVNSQWFGLHWMVLWSLAVEEQFYVFYPWFLRWLGRTRNFVIFLAVIFIMGPAFRGWAAVAHPENYWLEAISTFGVVDQLAVGCFLYVAWERLRSDLERMFWPRWILTILGGVTMFLVFTRTNHYDRVDMIWAPTLVAVGCFFFLLGGLSITWFELRGGWILTLPGKYSYGNYLLHTTVLFFMYSYLLSKPAIWAFPLYLAVATAVAALSFHLYEYPLNLWIRRHLDPVHSKRL